MIGFLIGLGCGAGELFLLYLVLRSLGDGKKGRILVLALCKLLLLVAAFVPLVLWFRSQLLWCGVGAGGSLVIGAVVIYLRSVGFKKGGDK